MNPTATWSLWLAGAYLAGSIPFGLLIGLARGVDIRRGGSGNVGATNVGRLLGRPWGVACFLLDVAKGLVPVLGYTLFAAEAPADADAAQAMRSLGVAAAAILGHIFPLWLRFRGGKGVATGFGVLLGLWPVLTVPALAAGAVWFAVVRVSGYVSLASMAAAAALPALALASGIHHDLDAGQTTVYVAVTALLAGLVIVRHRSNLAKLRAGAEPKATWFRSR